MLLPLELLLLAFLPSGRCAGVSTCYGFGGIFDDENNTRCPGSNACSAVGSTCLSNRLCHSPKDGPNRFIKGSCAVDPYDSGTCAQICLYTEFSRTFLHRFPFPSSQSSRAVLKKRNPERHPIAAFVDVTPKDETDGLAPPGNDMRRWFSLLRQRCALLRCRKRHFP
jgi:hypothetical protein